MTDPFLCPRCGSEVPADSPSGLCPKCLVLAGLESQAPANVPEVQSTRDSPSAAASDFVPPTVEALAAGFPQLEVVELIGRGGMGAVYKARQKELDRLVAVKVLPPEVSADPAFAERFTREARALARLNHPNIVAVYDFGRTDEGLFYFIMEYVDGVNLRQAIRARSVSPQEALAIVAQVCDALQFAHDEGIVHRDIKPENILLDKRGRVKIADFGLAKLLGQVPGDVSLTGTQQVMGTLRYMAPEQMEGAKEVDHRADIYSLGVVFYELLTGEVPAGRFAPPSRKVQIDVRLDEVVLRALEEKPEQRYQRASEVKTDVEAVQSASRDREPGQPVGAEGAAPPRPSTPEAAPSRTTRPNPRRRLRLLISLVAWTGALAGSVGYLTSLVWNNWWPCAFQEHWHTDLEPQSGAYKARLRLERRMYHWGQHYDRPILKQAWTGAASIDLPGGGAAATLEYDSFREEWRWTPSAGQAAQSQSEPRPEALARWMGAAGVDAGKPGIRQEAAALIGLVKEAANGFLPGGRRPRDQVPGGTKVGPFAAGGGGGGISIADGAVGPIDRRLAAALLFLAAWIPGLLFIVRRHRRRLAAADEEEHRYRVGTIGFWIAVFCLLGAAAVSLLPWVWLSSSSSDQTYACLALQNWHGMVTVVAVLAVTVLCFVTDFFGVRRSWQPMAIVAAGVVTVIATGTLCWRLAGSPAAVRVAEVRVHDWPQMAALATVTGAWRERELARGSFDPDSFPTALDQRSGPGLQLAAALGLALLGVGCAAVFRAHRQSVASAGAGQRPPTEGGGRATTGDRP